MKTAHKLILGMSTILSTLWRIYPRLLVDGMFPCGESNSIFRIDYLIKNGFFNFNIFYFPSLEYFLVYGISSLLRTSIDQVTYYINPIICGFAVIAFYYYVSSFLREKQSIVSSVLFAFSEAIYYRAANFGSTEILGMFFIFIFLGLFQRKKYAYSAVPLILAFFSHLLPFAFGLCVVMIPRIIERKFDIKKVIVCVFIVGLLFLASSFYMVQSRNIINSILRVNISNFLIYSPSEIIAYFQYYLGFLLLGILSLLYIKTWSVQAKSWFASSIMAIIGSFVAYSNFTIGPTRILPYVAIGLCIVVGSVFKSKTVILVIVLLSVVSPFFGGNNKIMWVSDSITTSETTALDWAASNHLFTAYLDPYGVKVVSYWDVDTPQLQYIELHYNTTKLPSDPMFMTQANYTLVSPRRLNQEFLQMFSYDSSRTQEIRKPLVDIWKNDPAWKTIYNYQNVTIYERIGGTP